jgi:hypothetical protein
MGLGSKQEKNLELLVRGYVVSEKVLNPDGDTELTGHVGSEARAYA